MKLIIYSRTNEGLKFFNAIKEKYPKNEITYLYDKHKDEVTKEIFNNRLKKQLDDSDITLILDKDIHKLLHTGEVALNTEYEFDGDKIKLDNNSKKGIHVIHELLPSLNIETCRIEL